MVLAPQLRPEGPGTPSVRDAAAGVAERIVLEDPAHDRGLDLVDLTIAADRLTVLIDMLDHVVAIAKPTAGLTGLDAATEPASRFVSKVLQIKRVHCALEVDMEVRDLALGQGNDPNSGKAHALVEPCDILLVAGKPVQCFRKDCVEL